mmetsp:Transcript_8182/g.25262  ORF Transcript_8182/g.25262 Transcript_8182/m.25262 type:complete len:98 (+) Transcript_8182:80-373(+)
MAALAANGGGGATVTKRLQKELMTLMTDGVPGVSAFPSSDSIFNWIGTLNGIAGTPYEGMTFKLDLQFPQVRSSLCGRLFSSLFVKTTRPRSTHPGA